MFEAIVQVFLQLCVVGVDMAEALQQTVGLHIVLLLAVEVDFAAPESFPVGMYLEQLVDVADGARVVACLFLDIDDELLGLDVGVVVTQGAHQIEAGVVVGLLVVVVAAGELVERRHVGVALQTFVEQTLAALPVAALEGGAHRGVVVVGQMDVLGLHYRLCLHLYRGERECRGCHHQGQRHAA